MFKNGVKNSNLDNEFSVEKEVWISLMVKPSQRFLFKFC